MKRFKKQRGSIVACIAIFILVAGCNKEFLEEKPYDFTAEEEFFNSEADAFSAIMGAYAVLQNESFTTEAMIGFGDLGTDVARHRYPGNWVDVDQYRYGPSYGRFEDYWNTAYSLISRTNAIIARVPEIEGDIEELNRIVGEAYFLRAFTYFNLVRMFGPIPVVTDPTSSVTQAFGELSQKERIPVNEVYQQIEADLIEAESLLPHRNGFSDDGRVMKMAAIVLQGKAYLQNRDYVKAEAKLRNALEDAPGRYQLFDNYYKAFHYDYKNGDEHVFSIQFSSMEGFLGTLNKNISPIVSGFGTRFGRGIWEIERGFFNSLPDHFRKNAILGPKEIKSSDGVSYKPNSKSIGPFKFWVASLSCKPEGEFNSCLNYPVLRWSDVLLMLAEAINENNGGPTAEAVELVNTVKRRARTEFSVALASDDVGKLVSDGSGSQLLLLDLTDPLLDYENFRNELLFERGMEFVLEGHRRWDLLRMGEDVFFERALNDPNPYNTLYPIPLTQLNIMSTVWKQNPGY